MISKSKLCPTKIVIWKISEATIWENSYPLIQADIWQKNFYFWLQRFCLLWNTFNMCSHSRGSWKFFLYICYILYICYLHENQAKHSVLLCKLRNLEGIISVFFREKHPVCRVRQQFDISVNFISLCALFSLYFTLKSPILIQTDSRFRVSEAMTFCGKAEKAKSLSFWGQRQRG